MEKYANKQFSKKELNQNLEKIFIKLVNKPYPENKKKGF